MTAPIVHTLPAVEARAIAMAYSFAAGRSALPGGVLNGITVHVGDLPGCYRISFVPDDDPTKTSVVRMAKPGDAGSAGCPDGTAPETVLSGPEAEGVAKVMRAWSTDALPGAPGVDLLASDGYQVQVNTVPADSTTLAPGTIAVGLRPAAVAQGSCPPDYDYDPSNGSIAKLPPTC